MVIKCMLFLEKKSTIWFKNLHFFKDTRPMQGLKPSNVPLHILLWLLLLLLLLLVVVVVVVVVVVLLLMFATATVPVKLKKKLYRAKTMPSKRYLLQK